MSPPAMDGVEDMKFSASQSQNSQTNGEEGDNVEARFSDFCKNGLSLDDNSHAQALKLFRETKHFLLTNMTAIGSGALEEAERYWFAFILYSVKRLSKNNADSLHQGSDESGLNLCHVLRKAKLNIVDFFKELPQFVVKAGPILSRIYGSDWESRLEAKELQANFVHLSILSNPTRPNPGGGGETCAETGINIFFSKFVKLAAVRISGMVERLQVSQQIRENVYYLFHQILNQKTSLLFNRHIDQIILCCFYGIAKISQLNLTFKEIIYNYRKQPHCKTQVFCSVFVDWSPARRNGRTGQDHVDIITFYNEMFIPVLKPLLVEIGPAGPTTKTNRVSEGSNNNDAPCPGSPKRSPFPSLPDMSPKKVSAAHNVYVSPLRSSKMDALISHSSKSYYACVGESTHAYQSPSKDLTDINNRLNGTRKLRGTLNFDDVDVGLVSDSMVANSLYLQNGSCASSSGTPVKSEEPDS